MKRHQDIPNHSPRQGGAVIIVVLSLLTTLVFLGLFFFNWTSQERANAEFFANSDPLEIDPDPIFDFGLRQVLVSTDDSLQNSALYGSRWSMLSHVIGAMKGDGTPTDLIPYNGTGITIRVDSTILDSTNSGTSDWRTIDNNGDGKPDNDQNIDGHLDLATAPVVGSRTFWFDYTGDNTFSATANKDILRMNFSPAANNGIDVTGTSTFQFTPDAGYTYPDINSLFLSFEDPATGVIIPSFFRPQYMPALRGTEGGFSNLYQASSSDYQAMVMRPHRSHVNASGSHSPRFVNSAPGTNALSGDRTRVISNFKFEVDVDNDGIYNEVGPLSVPPGATSGSRSYEFDADADGDGIRDAIYMDLDHKIIDMGNGRQVMPLFYFKVVDADGLLNVNVHGNLNQGQTYTHPYGNGAAVHRSNLGSSPSEINPLWALYSNPSDIRYLDSGTSLLDHAMREAGHAFGFSPSSYYPSASDLQRRFTTANMELALLLKGRTDSYGGPPHPGRWSTGSGSELVNFPVQPGITGTDDDNDMLYGGTSHTDPTGTLASATLPMQPAFVHPLDYVGRAQYPNMNPTGPSPTMNDAIRSIGGTPTTGSPAQWAMYDTNWQQAQGTYHGVTSLLNSPVGVQTGSVNALQDEPDEAFTEPALRNALQDRLFEPQEMAALFLSNADWAATQQGSRLRNLLLMNFEFSKQAEKIRKQFTTDSWDRKELGYTPSISNRNWEFKDGTTARFPPSFGTGAITSRHESNSVSSIDPFRPVTRRLLATPIQLPQDVATALGLSSHLGNTTNIGANRLLPQQRLNINKLLVNFDTVGNPLYRELTPHPAFDGTEGSDASNYLISGTYIRPMQHDFISTGAISFPNSGTLSQLDPDIPVPTTGGGTFSLCPLSAAATNRFAQEVWARYDRQRLARDIYVLLTVVGSASTNNPTSAPLPPAQAKEIAQFAVNYVDALDRDNVITRFDYDPDLTDGWTSGSLQSVYGVEAQTLTFSEVLALEVKRNTAMPTDRVITLMEEKDDTDHRFLYIELRNASPFSVNLQPDSWRIVRVPPNGPASATLAEVEIKGSPRTAGGEIKPGENFYISCHDGTATIGGGSVGSMPSDFYVNYKAGSELECAIPLASATTTVASNTTPPTQPLADLDLSWVNATPQNHAAYYTFTKKMGGVGTLVQANVDASAPQAAFDLVLQRKRNLQNEGLKDDLEWVEIDRFSIGPGDWRNFAPANDTQTDAANALNSVKSYERPQPLDGRKIVNASAATPYHTFSTSWPSYYISDTTVHQKNSALTSSSKFNLYQPHFDRDFSSVMDLLSIPLYGPPSLISSETYNPITDGSTATHFSDAGVPSGHFTAKIRFENPAATFPTSPANLYANSPPHYQNTWYRLFQFIKASPMENQFGEQSTAIQRRHPGKVNLNTIRHEPVLAGLIDDHVHLTPFSRNFDDTTGAMIPMTRDALDNTVFTSGSITEYRNWYRQMVIARDGFDPVLTNATPVSELNRITVPGLPGAHPFRGSAFIEPMAQEAGDVTANTLLRELPGVRNELNERSFGLFDATTVGDVKNGSYQVDSHTQKRLLAKVANLTTTRSHVFVIYAGYDLFDAHQPVPTDPTIVQIGGKAEDIPGRRMFCVVDMSRLEEAYSSVTQTFDFRKFVIHRQLLP